MDSSRRELSNGGFRIVAALSVRWQIDFLSARIGRPFQLYILRNKPKNFTFCSRGGRQQLLHWQSNTLFSFNDHSFVKLLGIKKAFQDHKVALSDYKIGPTWLKMDNSPKFFSFCSAGGPNSYYILTNCLYYIRSFVCVFPHPGPH